MSKGKKAKSTTPPAIAKGGKVPKTSIPQVEKNQDTSIDDGSKFVAKKYSLVNVWIISNFLKILLSIGYHSTDFEVHRNWLAITYNLPINQWYTDETSPWTLDYPPCFAYFEWILSHLVPPFVKRDGCLDLVQQGDYGLPTIFYQRFTVLVSEMVLLFALQWYINTCKSHSESRRGYVIASSLILSPGLLIIDHIHFQYNGMMYGILVLVINSARLKKYLMCGFWFSLLLCFKHIYLYLAPAVFVFLLRDYCLNFKSKSWNPFKLINWVNSIKLGLVVILTFGISFSPFIYYNQIPQLLERLFPFSRGLTHAYWAPNFWAIYSFFDRLLIQIYKNIPLSRIPLYKIFKFDPLLLLDPKFLNTSTRGIVGDTEFLVLPTITPKLTFFLTLFYQVMCLIPLFIQPTFDKFMGAMSLCGYASFLFGWHVHEKAILLVIFPITFIIVKDKRLLPAFNLLVSCGYVSLFPLIFTSSEWLIKVLYTFLWYVIYSFNFRNVTRIPKHLANSNNEFILDRFINLYILGILAILLVISLIDLFEHKFEFLKKLQFLKFIIISVYCGIGIISSWNGFSWLYFVNDSIFKDD
ncbi:dolichyl pyrophosphate Glc1Man9GlcNAc2 alpha-1,3-glucosyltransferase [[Candida] jaroonii]|uniref:Dolichyl pyrophosphate Glc1Man9GlcNAc2 alpha-1,3-glucosyltransferase n=1 Tax=[Candida] jaroonii TaxID=467808 RepID=A0ACA9Y5S1_9ASCO|nr:dolichyl pyrophosphate Glc1Man9GlcNAc2 alpha-1,3-glucosyltransferase [[Candida] jaroonii]